MILSKISNNLKQYGLGGFIWRTFKKVFRLIGISYDSYYYLINEIDYQALQKKWKENSVDDVRQLTLEDYKQGDVTYFTEEKMSLLSERLLRGDYVGYGVFEKERLVYSAMISLKELCFPTPEIGGDLDEGEFLISDVYCDPDQRGKGFHNRMTVYVLMKGYEMGFKRSVTTVLKENKPSLKPFLNSGYRVLFGFYTLRVGGKSYTNYYKKKISYVSR